MGNMPRRSEAFRKDGSSAQTCRSLGVGANTNPVQFMICQLRGSGTHFLAAPRQPTQTKHNISKQSLWTRGGQIMSFRATRGLFLNSVCELAEIINSKQVIQWQYFIHFFCVLRVIFREVNSVGLQGRCLFFPILIDIKTHFLHSP